MYLYHLYIKRSTDIRTDKHKRIYIVVFKTCIIIIVQRDNNYILSKIELMRCKDEWPLVAARWHPVVKWDRVYD